MKTTTAAARATTTPANMWAVLDRNGGVVVLFGGQEAEAEARDWRGRGYRIAQLTD
ncbi:MAG TPA: hypothetical protein VHF47_04645 [Acidimicrobiales bacterium]|nr:hypothetical protein [Acidimicrobiales bacterium]